LKRKEKVEFLAKNSGKLSKQLAHPKNELTLPGWESGTG
jgi:hypothetical protein